MEDLKKVGHNIKVARVKKNLTQEEASKLLDITREQISFIERTGKTKVSTLFKLAKYYDCKISDFFVPYEFTNENDENLH